MAFLVSDGRMRVNVEVWKQEGPLSNFQKNLGKASADTVDLTRFWDQLPARKAPTEAVKYAVDLSYDWFERNESVMQLFEKEFNIHNMSSTKDSTGIDHKFQLTSAVQAQSSHNTRKEEITREIKLPTRNGLEVG